MYQTPHFYCDGKIHSHVNVRLNCIRSKSGEGLPIGKCLHQTENSFLTYTNIKHTTSQKQCTLLCLWTVDPSNMLSGEFMCRTEDQASAKTKIPFTICLVTSYKTAHFEYHVLFSSEIKEACNPSSCWYWPQRGYSSRSNEDYINVSLLNTVDILMLHWWVAVEGK